MKIQSLISNETEWLLYHLSLKDLHSDQKSSFPFYVPDTFIYKYGELTHPPDRISNIPQQWYFTSRSGQVCRKYPHNLTLDNMRAAIASKYSATDIVGVAYGFSCDSKDEAVTVTTEYVDKNGLGIPSEDNAANRGIHNLREERAAGLPGLRRSPGPAQLYLASSDRV